MWQADNRKCMDIGEKGIQRAVPKGFPYMLVEWETKAGERGALVHVIEDEKVFKRNFAQDVLAGMMDLPTSAMLRSGSQETASVVGSAMCDSRVVAVLLEDLEKVRLDGRAGRVLCLEQTPLCHNGRFGGNGSDHNRQRFGE